MKATVYCKNREHGKLDFFVNSNGVEHYLFGHRFVGSLMKFYKTPVVVDDALDFTLARENNAILAVMEKLIPYIRFIEQEYETTILRLTERKQEKKRLGSAKHRSRRLGELRMEELSTEAYETCFCDEDDEWCGEERLADQIA